MRNKTILFALISLALSSGAWAQSFSYTGTGGAIPDNVPAGVNFDIIITDSGTISSFDSILVPAFHSWVGDLTFRLTHVETATTVVFMQKVQSGTTGGAGDSSNLGVGTTLVDYTFDNTPSTISSANSIWQAATGGTSTFDIVSGTFGASANSFSGVAATSYVATSFSTFVGQSIAGTWRFNVADNALIDTGSIGAWKINGSLAPVLAPEPGALALLGLALLPGTALLRRRK